MRTAESCSILIVINTDTLSEYAEKKRNAIYAQHQITTIRHVAFKKCQQDTDASTAIEITQHKLQNATREKNM